MKEIRDYINKTFKDIPKSKEKKHTVQRVIDSLEEKVKDLIESGNEEEEAISIAISEFGSIDDFIEDLNDINIKKTKVSRIRNAFIYSILGSILLIGLSIFINLYYSPSKIWFVFPVFVILWWPISILYGWLNTKDSR